MIDDEFLDSQVEPSATRPDGKPATVAFFIKSLELYDIVNDVLAELYMNSGEKSAENSDYLVPVLRFDDRLVRWVSSLPAQLLYTSDPMGEGLVLRRQRVVMRMR